MLLNLNPKTENTIKKLARESWGSTIYHRANPTFSQKKHILSPVVVLGSPDLRISGTFYASWGHLVNPGLSFKKWFSIFSEAKIVKIINFQMIKFQTSFFSFFFGLRSSCGGNRKPLKNSSDASKRKRNATQGSVPVVLRKALSSGQQAHLAEQRQKAKDAIGGSSDSG